MKAVILAAGLGTRLMPLTASTHKTLLQIGDKPLLGHTLEALADNGIKDIFLVVSHRKEQVKGFFGDGSKFNVNIKYLEQKNPRGGTADAVRQAEGRINEGFIVLNGDILFDKLIIKNLIEKYKECDGVISCKEVENPWDYGTVLVEGERVVKIIEKMKNPPTNLANIGIYIMPREIFDAINSTKLSVRGEYEITESIQILIDRGMKFKFLKTNGFWMDVGKISDYEKAKEIYEKNC
jgi:bifunctional UDP-N-acetylglucosamine pyrophosphorylase/glucosamine-1-phosphate N-acetyltransferase